MSAGSGGTDNGTTEGEDEPGWEPDDDSAASSRQRLTSRPR
ncbi:hypothetical protein ACIOEX_11400 [Streptomyces sp. NPDC087850]